MLSGEGCDVVSTSRISSFCYGSTPMPSIGVLHKATSSVISFPTFISANLAPTVVGNIAVAVEEGTMGEGRDGADETIFVGVHMVIHCPPKGMHQGDGEKASMDRHSGEVCPYHLKNNTISKKKLSFTLNQPMGFLAKPHEIRH